MSGDENCVPEIIMGLIKAGKKAGKKSKNS
jgi:hypothetical protein